MNPWRWVRARKWWIQLLLAAVVVPVALAGAYVAVRTLQYHAVERDAGVYVPTGANVVVRARGLESHLVRIKESPGWHSLDRRVLRDAVLRRQINDLLKGNGAPTLDDLEDERQPFAKHQTRVLHAIGDDVIATLQVRDSLAKAPFCALVRLRWLHYLATPFAGCVLPTEDLDGHRVLVIQQGRQQILVAFVGSLAIASSDKALLGQALRRQGSVEESERPLAGRVTFEGSPGLLQLRRALQDAGVLPVVKWETARGLSFTADLRESMLKVDARVDGAEPLHAGAPPVALRSWAPVTSTGVMLTNTGGADLIAWVRGLGKGAGPKDVAAQTINEALATLDHGGLQSALLPQLGDGMGVVTGVEERDGRSFSALVLVLPARDPAAAVEAMNAMVKKIAGSYGDSKYFRTLRVGEVTLNSWTWPQGLQINDLLSPTYGAVKEYLVIGNNASFTEQLVRTAAEGGGFEETSEFRRLRTRMKEEGFAAEPALAGGFLFPPLFRASLDGILGQAAKQMVYGTLNGAAHRAEVLAELRRGGGNPSEADIVKAYNEGIERKIDEQEAALRRNLEPLNGLRWAAFEASAGDKGIAVRAAVELR